MARDDGRHAHAHRRYRPVHRRGVWLGRAGSTVALVAVVALGLAAHRPDAVAQLTAAEDRRLCAVLETVVALLSDWLPPPVDASPAESRAIEQVNAELSRRRAIVRGLPSMKEIGCG